MMFGLRRVERSQSLLSLALNCPVALGAWNRTRIAASTSQRAFSWGLMSFPVCQRCEAGLKRSLLGRRQLGRGGLF